MKVSEPTTGKNRQRLDRIRSPAHEEGEQRLGREPEQRGERERVVEAGDDPVVEHSGMGPGGAGEDARHGAARHPAARRGLGANAGGHRPGRNQGARNAQPGQHHRRQGDGGDARHRPRGHQARAPVADQQPLVEAPVADRRRPGHKQPERPLDEQRHLPGEREYIECDEVEHRRQKHQQEHPGGAGVQEEGEAPQLAEAVRVLREGRGGGHQHHDRGLHQHRDGEGHAVGREVDLGVGQPRDDRGEEGPLHRHHQPCGGQRSPEEQDGPLRERRGNAQRVSKPITGFPRPAGSPPALRSG